MSQAHDDSSRTTDPAAPELMAAARPLRLGQLIEGRYRVREQLEAGRSGAVYRVHDRVLAEDIALKVLLPELVDNPRGLERFRREVKLARKIAHPNVCRVFDVGAADGLAFITMELLKGETLRAYIARGAGSMTERLSLFEQVARGLAAVHVEGILHRDVKPENVFLREDGTAVLSDFGLAIEPEEGKSFSTFAGAPLYRSPEQLRCEPVDARSDVFGPGLVGYELITGSRPFGTGAPAVVMSAILRDDPAPLNVKDVSEQVAVDLSARLELAVGYGAILRISEQIVLDLSALLLRMVAKSPGERPSAASVADALAALREAIQLAPPSGGAMKLSVGHAAPQGGRPLNSERERAREGSLLSSE